MNINSIKQLNRNVKLRLIEQFASSLAGNMIFPFMIIYFSEAFGEAITGILFVSNIVISFVSGLYGGYLADKLGRRKIMIYAEVCRFIALFIMAIACTEIVNSPVIVFFMNIITSACSGFSRPAGDAMLIDSSSNDDRKLIYTIDYILWNASLLIGGIVGGFLFQDYKFQLILSLSIISLASLFLLLFFIRDMYTPLKRSLDKPINLFSEINTNYKVVIKDKLFTIFLMASLLELAVQIQAMNYTGVRLVKEMQNQELFHFKDMHFMVDGYKMYGILNFTNTICVLVLAVLINKLSKKFKDKSNLTVGIIFYSIGFSMISFINMPILLIFLMLVVVVGELIYIPTKQSLLAEIIPTENRGSYMAINGMTNKGASILGSIAVTIGAFIPSIGMSIIFLTMGLISIIFYRQIYRLRNVLNKETKSIPDQEYTG
ncbi:MULTISPECIES: MFS transporter [Bacillus]|uniref:MFS transporter n=1 Tax=Bacillus TaxID=1386 RepID=UPI000D7C78DA|nr:MULTISPECIES: MFS transporter [Bacillus]MDA1656360.1 MFS transporter [Bacillus cereus group sp. TH150LC]PYE91526.1 DHA1 family multidrug resistance protein B-like MFS transporter [Bacillus sp. 196mf]